MQLSDLKIFRFVLSDFEENCYVLVKKDSNDCVLIDPGLEPEEMIEKLKQNHFTPIACLITHGHYDHIGGLPAIEKEWPNVQVYIGERERSKLTDPMGNLSGLFGFPMTLSDTDRTLSDDETIELAGLVFRAYLLPGHSLGHLVYELVTEDPDKVLFVGDTIFSGSIGRTDFPEGSHGDLLRGIQDKIFPFSDKTVLYPGHGPQTTVGEEKRSNPWLQV